MHVTNLGKGYYCPSCERYFVGVSPKEVQVTTEYTEPGQVWEDLPTRTALMCHDSPPCEYDENDNEFIVLDTIYECGDCEERYEDFADAVACCKAA